MAAGGYHHYRDKRPADLQLQDLTTEEGQPRGAGEAGTPLYTPRHAADEALSMTTTIRVHPSNRTRAQIFALVQKWDTRLRVVYEKRPADASPEAIAEDDQRERRLQRRLPWAIHRQQQLQTRNRFVVRQPKAAQTTRCHKSRPLCLRKSRRVDDLAENAADPSLGDVGATTDKCVLETHALEVRGRQTSQSVVPLQMFADQWMASKGLTSQGIKELHRKLERGSPRSSQANSCQGDAPETRVKAPTSEASHSPDYALPGVPSTSKYSGAKGKGMSSTGSSKGKALAFSKNYFKGKASFSGQSSTSSSAENIGESSKRSPPQVAWVRPFQAASGEQTGPLDAGTIHGAMSGSVQYQLGGADSSSAGQSSQARRRRESGQSESRTAVSYAETEDSYTTAMSSGDGSVDEELLTTDSEDQQFEEKLASLMEEQEREAAEEKKAKQRLERLRTHTIPHRLARWAELDGPHYVLAAAYLRDADPDPAHGFASPTGLSTAEVWTLAKRFAHVLRHTFYIFKRAVVANLLPQSPERLVVDLAIILAGGVILCLDPDDVETDTLHHALVHSLCKLVVTTEGSPVHTYGQCLPDRAPDDHDSELLAICALNPRDYGFLAKLWNSPDLPEYVDPDPRPEQSAAVFIHEDYKGTRQLIFYQQESLLQVGAQMTSILSLRRDQDVLFNPSSPKHPWGLPVAFLHSGVTTVTFDRMPCRRSDLDLGRREVRDAEYSKRQSVFCGRLRNLDVNVAFVSAPELNAGVDYFLDRLVTLEWERRRNSIYIENIGDLDRDLYTTFERLAITGSHSEMERASCMLQACKVTRHFTVTSSVLFGLVTSHRETRGSRTRWRARDTYCAGKVLDHVKLDLYQPREMGTAPVRSMGLVTFTSRRPLSHPAKPLLEEGFVNLDLEHSQVSEGGYVGYVNDSGILHYIGSIRPSVSIRGYMFSTEMVSVNLRRIEACIRGLDNIVDAAVVHVLAADKDRPQYAKDEVVAIFSHDGTHSTGVLQHRLRLDFLRLTDVHDLLAYHDRPHHFIKIDRMPYAKGDGSVSVIACDRDGGGEGHRVWTREGVPDRQALVALAWEARRRNWTSVSFRDIRPESPRYVPVGPPPRSPLSRFIDCWRNRGARRSVARRPEPVVTFVRPREEGAEARADIVYRQTDDVPESGVVRNVSHRDEGAEAEDRADVVYGQSDDVLESGVRNVSPREECAEASEDIAYRQSDDLPGSVVETVRPHEEDTAERADLAYRLGVARPQPVVGFVRPREKAVETRKDFEYHLNPSLI